MIEYDVIATPAGPCTVEREAGKLTRIHLSEQEVPGGRRTRLDEVRRWLADWFEGKPVKVPLDLEGTPFARAVYRAVQRIPMGETRTYGEIADAAGRPGAARAVGNLMAHNRFPLFIPCHRVVASSGLGGFNSPRGLEQKKELLALERRPRS